MTIAGIRLQERGLPRDRGKVERIGDRPLDRTPASYCTLRMLPKITRGHDEIAEHGGMIDELSRDHVDNLPFDL